MTSAAHSRGTKFFIVGGAGFIGSHVTDRLLASREIERVTLYDNFSSGRDWHYAHHASDPRLAVIRADVKDLPCLRSAMDGHDVVIHLASNPDIARAAVEPDIDFREGTVLTQNVVEAMRTTNTKRVLYTSGSGVYGDVGELETNEDWGPLIPISTYAASKLAGEALISSYCAMFDLTACVFRFANVVGPRQTHGVGFDFLRKLADDPTTLRGTGRWHAEQVCTSMFRMCWTRSSWRIRRHASHTRSTTSAPAITSPCGKSPISPSIALGSSQDRSASSSPVATAAGRATCPSFA